MKTMAKAMFIVLSEFFFSCICKPTAGPDCHGLAKVTLLDLNLEALYPFTYLVKYQKIL